jgi:succinate dehydrogenase / fumarate reductase flavoprotein subunit
MTKSDVAAEVISTDVLIIGGGLGGLAAAIEAKRQPVDVLVVDKQTIGWSGKAPKIGGGMWVMLPDDDVQKFAEYHVKNVGFYLNDQELLEAYARESFRAVEQLIEWGVNLARDTDGGLKTSRHQLNLWSGTGIDRDLLLPLRTRALKTGVRTLDKVQIVDLLTQHELVTGAIGFGLIDCRPYIFQAKAVILANGACNYRVKRMWASGTGDGIAAAFRAGAEMRNAEFGNFFDIDRQDTDLPAPSGAYAYLFNALGENISERYAKVKEADTPTSIILGMEKEVNEGRGPIYLDPSELQWDLTKQPPVFVGRWGMPRVLDYWSTQAEKQRKYGRPPATRVEVAPALNGEVSPVKVDHEMRTNLAGLWAVGDTCYQGSTWAGAIWAPPGRLRGSGVMNTLFTALRGGPSAALFAAQQAPPAIDTAEARRLQLEMFAPLRSDRGVLPEDALYALQEVVCKIKYNVRRNQQRLEEALSKIEDLSDKLGALSAKDGHYLGKCHEVKAMTAVAAMTFRAALMRTESRGSHFREDYPARDDRNWLKWIIVKQENGRTTTSTEPVPIERYKIKPE